MAANDDLDNFFKKKDRKGNKQHKQTGLLTNNEELFKQLVTVTSATSAFKENMDFDDEDFDNEILQTPGPIVEPKHFHEQQINTTHKDPEQQQDEWEEFIDSNYRHGTLRSKFITENNDDDDQFYNDDDENNPNNTKNQVGSNDQKKEKPAWKIDQIKETTTTTTTTNPIVEETKPISSSPPKQTGAYRPPQLRTGPSITVVSGTNQRISKKKEPNLASTDEFPTLKSTVNKKIND